MTARPHMIARASIPGWLLALACCFAPALAAAQGTIQPGSPEAAELEELAEVVDRYGEAATDHGDRLKVILSREYAERQRKLEGRYKRGLEGARSEYERRQLSAIEELERFLRRYPDDPKWTPDVMFRLAELYLDEAGLEYEKRLAAQMSGEMPEPAPFPEEGEDDSFDLAPMYDGPDYSKAISLWLEIVKRFPEYRQLEGTLYLLAFYYDQMGKSDAAKQAFMGLVCPNKYDALTVAPPPDPAEARRRQLEIQSGRQTFQDPYADCTPRTDSPIVDEAWVRVGRDPLRHPGEINEAIAAYRKIADKPDSAFFNEALYKLAWSYYRNDQFMDSIQAFDELVVTADRQEAETGKRSLELRKEAIDYIAINFADPWDPNEQPDPAKSLERAFAFYKGRTEEPHVRDVFEQLGDTLRAGEAHDQAVAAWRYALENWPMNPHNPVVHQKIVDSLTLKGDTAAAMEERRKLSETYRKGSDWYAANETNREAMEAAQNLAEQSLLAAAKATHRRAQVMYQEWVDDNKPAGQKAPIVEKYRQAATLYEEYLREYPTSKEAYELTYFLADAYFFAEEYMKAVPNYRWVRDQREQGSKYFEQAALSIVQAYEQAIDRAKTGGTITEPPIPTAEALEASSAPLPIPEMYQGLQQAYDEYMQVIDDPKTAPKMALGSAMVSYRHLQLDDARRRFQIVMDRYCQTEEAVQAKDGLLLIYQAKDDDPRFKATIDRFVRNKCGQDKDRELAVAQRRSKEYQIAADLYEAERYAEAANAFYNLYKTAPPEDENRDDALFSAAVAFKRAGRPKTAIAIYQEFTGNEKLRDSQFYVEALYRTAQSYQEAFDYENAVDTYLRVQQLASERGRKSRPEFDLEQAQLDAMWNAAVLRDQDRVYYDRSRTEPGAATLYQRYARAENKDRARARDAYFKSVLVYEKAGDTQNMIKTFADFRQRYGNDKEAGPLVAAGWYKAAKAMEKANNSRSAADYYEQVIRAFDRYNIEPGSPAAELAGEAAFWNAEQYYANQFEPYKVRWKGNIASPNEKKAQAAVKNTLDALAGISKQTASRYNDVARFESSWSLGSIVRLGDIAFFAGQKLIDAPVPSEITKLDNQHPEAGVLDAYLTRIETLVAPQSEDAQTNWVKAVETARAAGVANQWSKLAQRRLNTYISSDEYPVQRDEIIDKVELP